MTITFTKGYIVTDAQIARLWEACAKTRAPQEQTQTEIDLNDIDHINALYHACMKIREKSLTQAQAEAVINIARQVRSMEEIKRDNAEEQKDQDEEKRGDYR